MRMSHDAKEQALAGMRLLGTKKAGALAANIPIEKLNEEIKKSAVFKKRANEALTSGKFNLADNALDVIREYAYGDMIRECPICKGSGKTKKSVDGELGECKFCDGKGSVEVKTDRNKLTAAIALANAFIPGFRGATTVQGRIDHDVRVITAVPRPNYQIIEPEKKLLDKPSDNMLKLGKRTKKIEIRDEQGNYIGTKVETVEDVIEGEVIKESE